MRTDEVGRQELNILAI